MKKPKRRRFTLRWYKSFQVWRCVEIPNQRWVCSSNIKKFAVGHARQAVRAYMPSQLVVYKKNGRIQTEHTYGQDPRKSKG